MTPRLWAVFIVINVIVSAVTVLVVLNLWEAGRTVPRAVIPTAMNTAAQSAEPARGVPSTGREQRSNITKDMNLTEAMDAAFEELGLTGR